MIGRVLTLASRRATPAGVLVRPSASPHRSFLPVRVRDGCICAGLLPLLASCTAMGLGDFDLSCKVDPLDGSIEDYKDNDPCAALNKEHGIDILHDCYVYQCVPDHPEEGCKKRAKDLDQDGSPSLSCRGMEPEETLDCDDGDNRRAPSQPEICDTIDNNCDQGALIDEGLDWQAQDGLSRSAPEVVQNVSHFELDTSREVVLVTSDAGVGDYQTEGLVLEAFADQLPRPTVLAQPSTQAACYTGTCRFRELVAAAVGDTLFRAGISRQGCGAGLLQIGATRLDPSSPLTPWSWAPADSACPEDAPRLSDLAIVASGDEQGARAFLAWKEARSEGTNIVGQGLRISETPTTALKAVSPRLVIGQSGPGRLALIDWAADTEPGYTIAYASSPRDRCGGKLALLSLSVTQVDSAALAEPLCLVGSEEADQLALAAARLSSGQKPSALGVAWRARSKIWFTAVKADGGSLAPSTEIIEIASSGAVGGPAAIYAPEGFTDGSVATGGWTLLWVEGGPGTSVQRVVGVRIAERKLGQIGDLFVLHEGRRLDQLFAYPVKELESGRIDVGYGFVRRAAETELRTAVAACRARRDSQ